MAKFSLEFTRVLKKGFKLRQTGKVAFRSMSDNENGLSISSASSRRASSESLDDSIRKILNTSDGRVTGFLERYAVYV